MPVSSTSGENLQNAFPTLEPATDTPAPYSWEGNLATSMSPDLDDPVFDWDDCLIGNWQVAVESTPILGEMLLGQAPEGIPEELAIDFVEGSYWLRFEDSSQIYGGFDAFTAHFHYQTSDITDSSFAVPIDVQANGEFLTTFWFEGEGVLVTAPGETNTTAQWAAAGVASEPFEIQPIIAIGSRYLYTCSPDRLTLTSLDPLEPEQPIVYERKE